MVTTTYFLASDDELTAACKGWRIPLATPGKKSGTHPFTGEPLVVDDYDPRPGAPFPGAALNVELASLPKATIDLLDIVRLATLMQVLLPEADWGQCYRPARIAPPEAEVAVCVVPPELVSAIAIAPEDSLPELTKRWLSALLAESAAAPEVQSKAELSPQTLLPALTSLRSLARQSVLSDRGLYSFLAL